MPHHSLGFRLTSAAALQLPLQYTLTGAITLFGADVAMLLGSFWLARLLVHPLFGHNHSVGSIYAAGIWIATVVAGFYLLGLYRHTLAESAKDDFYFAAMALIIVALAQQIIATFLPLLGSLKLLLFTAAAISIPMVAGSRSILAFWGMVGAGRSARLLVAGSADSIDLVRKNLRIIENHGVEVLTLDTNLIRLQAKDDKSQLQSLLIDFSTRWGCDRMILAGSEFQADAEQVFTLGESAGVRVYLAVPNVTFGAYSVERDCLGLQNVLVPTKLSLCTVESVLLKRFLDIFVATCVLLVAAPVMLVVALTVYTDSGRPVLFRQARVGRNGRIFHILKFRTMKVDADSQWAVQNDARITRSGAFLRRTSLDELPQLFNVLKGDMSLVGPRPEMIEFERQFAETIPSYARRRLALPGITGWAQVNMKRNLSPEDIHQVIAYDLFYVEHWSIYLDLTVLLKTGVEFLFHRAV